MTDSSLKSQAKAGGLALVHAKASLRLLQGIGSLTGQSRTGIVLPSFTGLDYNLDRLLIALRVALDVVSQPCSDQQVVLGIIIRQSDLGVDRIQALALEYAHLGILTEAIRPASDHDVSVGLAVEQWLTNGKFGRIVAVDGGIALHLAAQKRASGQGFIGVAMVQILVSPWLAHLEIIGLFARSMECYARDARERQTCKLVDQVITGQPHLQQWLLRNKWLEHELTTAELGWPSQYLPTLVNSEQQNPTRQLLFIGHFDESHGLDVFLDALCILEDRRDLAGWKVELRGMPGITVVSNCVEMIATAQSKLKTILNVKWSDTLYSLFQGITPDDTLIINLGAIIGGELLVPFCKAHGFSIVSTLADNTLNTGYISPFDVRNPKIAATKLAAAMRKFIAMPSRLKSPSHCNLGDLVLNDPVRFLGVIPTSPSSTHVVILHRGDIVGLTATLTSLWLLDENELKTVTVVDGTLPDCDASRATALLEEPLAFRNWSLVRPEQNFVGVGILQQVLTNPDEIAVIMWAGMTIDSRGLADLVAPISGHVADLTAGWDIGDALEPAEATGSAVLGIFSNVTGQGPLATSFSMINSEQIPSDLDLCSLNGRWLYPACLLLRGARFIGIQMNVDERRGLSLTGEDFPNSIWAYQENLVATKVLSQYVAPDLKDLVRLSREQVLSKSQRSQEGADRSALSHQTPDARCQAGSAKQRAQEIALLAKEFGRPDTAVTILLGLPVEILININAISEELAECVCQIVSEDRFKRAVDQSIDTLPTAKVCLFICMAFEKAVASSAWVRSEYLLDKLQSLGPRFYGALTWLSQCDLGYLPENVLRSRLESLELKPELRALELFLLKHALSRPEHYNGALNVLMKKRLKYISV